MPTFVIPPWLSEYLRPLFVPVEVEDEPWPLSEPHAPLFVPPFRVTGPVERGFVLDEDADVCDSCGEWDLAGSGHEAGEPCPEEG